MSRFQAVFPEDRTDINLSPMLDVVFIMLIFFIVVAVDAGYGIGFSPVTIMPLDPQIEAPGPMG